jgi:hypothetical protein
MGDYFPFLQIAGGTNLAATLRIVGMLLGSYVLLLWLAVIVWVYRDVTSRTRDLLARMSAVVWSIICPFLGLPIYFVLRPRRSLQDQYESSLTREAILSDINIDISCPDCSRLVSSEWTFCPFCQVELKKKCRNPECDSFMDFSWSACASCGTSVTS